MRSPKKHLKYFFFIVLAAALGVAVCAGAWEGGYKLGRSLGTSGNNQAMTAAAEAIVPAAPQAEADLSKEVKMVFIGDIMLDRGVRKSVAENFDGDYSLLFQNTDFLKEADIAFANLEGPASDQGQDIHNLYSFRMDPKVIPILKNAGFSALSIANNHIGDWGRAAFEDTLFRLEKADILPVGAGVDKTEAEAPKIIEKNGLKIGFLGFSDVGPDALAATDNKSGILLASDPNLDQIIKNAASQCDDLVISYHFGVEYSATTKRQEDLAHRAIDDGARLVIGTHPHVVQDTEEYHGGLIAYSLGNFIFDQAFSKNTMSGMALSVTLDQGGLKDYNKKSINLNALFQPEFPTDLNQ